MSRVTRLTPTGLRRLVLQEKRRLKRSMREVLETGESDPEKAAAKTPEVDADELADSLEKDVDWMKALKIHESKLKRKLKKIQEAKKQLRKRLVRRLQ